VAADASEPNVMPTRLSSEQHPMQLLLVLRAMRCFFNFLLHTRRDPLERPDQDCLFPPSQFILAATIWPDIVESTVPMYHHHLQVASITVTEFNSRHADHEHSGTFICLSFYMIQTLSSINVFFCRWTRSAKLYMTIGA
jgi:hypothetical protein